MATITVKEQPRIVSRRTSWQGSVEVNGETVDFRYVDDWDGLEFYVYRDNNYREVSRDDMTEAEQIAFDLCVEYNVEEIGAAGETFEFPDDF